MGVAVSFAGQPDVAKWDPNMAQRAAVVTNGVKWIDMRSMARAFGSAVRQALGLKRGKE